MLASHPKPYPYTKSETKYFAKVHRWRTWRATYICTQYKKIKCCAASVRFHGDAMIHFKAWPSIFSVKEVSNLRFLSVWQSVKLYLFPYNCAHKRHPWNCIMSRFVSRLFHCQISLTTTYHYPSFTNKEERQSNKKKESAILSTNEIVLPPLYVYR